MFSFGPRVRCPACRIGLVGALLVLASVAAGGEMASFAVRVQDELRVADVEILQQQGVPYVSLPSLVRQIGGGCGVTPERVQVDLVSKSAWLKLNAPDVTASVGDFWLSHPVLEYGNDVLIAVNDVTPFFEQAFRLAVKQDTAAASPPPETREPVQPETPAAPATPVPDQVPAAPPVPTTPPVPTEPQQPETRAIQVVILDPGHGGSDAGCIGSSGAKESALTLAIAEKVLAALKPANASGAPKVLLSRDKDRDVPRTERVNVAVASKGDLVVSLHIGSGFARTATGFALFCDSGEGAQAQEGAALRPGAGYAARSREIASVVGAALAEATGAEDRGVRSVPCRLLGDLPMPGVLIEVGFLNNPAEETLLLSDAYQEKVAEGIAAGIKKCVAGSGGGRR